MSIPDSLALLLASCEEEGPAAPYHIDAATYREATRGFFSPFFPATSTPVTYRAGTEELIIISDLHMAAGRNPLGVYTGSENFFADEAFDRFLGFTTTRLGSRKAVLVLNGDTFDFLRVTEYPGKIPAVTLSAKVKQLVYNEVRKPVPPPFWNTTEGSFEAWQQELEKVGIRKTVRELEDALSDREKTYGLETDDYKTIYKLMRIRLGHPAFFHALSRWLSAGHRLVFTKGNHDLELVWPAVRNYIRVLLAMPCGGADIESFLRDNVLPRVFFADDAILVDDSVYIEHGHRYDKFAMVLQSPWFAKNTRQISIPFGSFFNRYLINRVELFYPYLDKVRPTGNVLPILVRENFPLALRIFGLQLPFMIRILFTNGRYVWFMLKRVVPLLLAALPVAYYIYLLFFSGNKIAFGSGPKPGILSAVWKMAGTTGSLVLSYLVARIVAWLQLVEPSSLDGYAHRLYQETKRRYPIICMGHTHNPGAYLNDPGGLFFNTGTWIPVIETSTAEVRADRTFTFLQLVREAGGGYRPTEQHLQRWNDDAGRPEPQLLIKRKS